MATKTPVGLRALTMQQPFAAAMAAGVGLFSRRGKPAKFHAGKPSKEWKGSTPTGEWVAVHCGQNTEHLKNAALMKQVRAHWPECPSDDELRAQQRCILGVIHFVEGDLPAASGIAAQDFFLNRYTCTKTAAWRGDQARSCHEPLSYPKGNLQVWRLNREGFADGAASERALLTLVEGGPSANVGGVDTKVKVEKMTVKQEKVTVKHEKEASAAGATRPAKRIKREPKP